MKEQRRSWASLYAWQLTRTGDAPLFRQIYLQIRSAILSQSLRPGTKLPSTRELASQLSVSRSAVVSAYEQLLADDINANGVFDSSHQEATIALTGSTSEDVVFEGLDTLDLFLSGKALRQMLNELAATGAI